MNIDPHEEIRRALETALAIEPAPGFPARVRSRIAREDRRRPGLAVWRGALVLTAGAIVALVMTWVSAPGDRTRMDTATSNAPPQTGVRAHDQARSSPAEEQPSSTPAAAGPSSLERESTTTRPAGAKLAAARTVVTRGNANPLVPDDQRIALLRLLGALRAGRATVPPTAVAAFDADGALVAPAPVVVAPLTIDPLPIPDPQGEPEGDRR